MNESDAHAAKILIVDDQPANVVMLEKMLLIDGFTRIWTTTDPRIVADLYREHHFDLVLLDIRMPHMDGFEVMEQITKLEPDTYLPVLILTAQDDMETRLRALEKGAQDFITKPFVRLEVIKRIRNMLEVRLLHNQVRDQNRILEERVRERTRELNETRLEIIQRLGRAVEFRDNETGDHVIRMSQFSARLGRAAGLNSTQEELLLNASPMHDIGKIGIPDRILLKPGKLNAEEWEIMKTHATIGAKILSGHNSELLQMSHDIALTHHEKWDGTGYPNGLKGEQIPLVGRIVAICDAFDALTSKRPYKEAWAVEKAMTEIHNCRGNHFDPQLVDLLTEILPDILNIRSHGSTAAEMTASI
ncbi:MAG: HD domain-containing phosphohydrolase [Leptospirillia bacterium]